MTHATRARRSPVPHGLFRGAACALLLSLFAAPAARADARREAKRRFREGMALVAAGEGEPGIAELKQAHAIQPHPAPLYNNPRAHVDLGKNPAALDDLPRYRGTQPA